MAHGTGGLYFHNNNDLDAGFRLTAGTPEFSYSIAFTPSDLKFDGSFHKLSVHVKRAGSYSVLARPGYLAPATAQSAKEDAQQEIEQIFFSADEMEAIPIALSTQYFKAGADVANLDVLARVSVRQLPFRKETDRNIDTLIVVSGLFDSNGHYVEGVQKTIDFRLRDDTLARLGSGIIFKSRFKVKPGSYFIRVVARDSEGQLLSARSLSLQIP